MCATDDDGDYDDSRCGKVVQNRPSLGAHRTCVSLSIDRRSTDTNTKRRVHEVRR